MRAAARLFPASWVTAANARPLLVVSNGQAFGGRYVPVRNVEHSGDVAQAGTRTVHLPPQGHAAVVVSADPANAVHEYTHHLQSQMPRLDGLFQALHRRRTRNEPVIDLPRYPGMRGRKDQYIDEYFGEELAGYADPALEVMTRTYQILFHSLYGKERLGKLACEDPEMLGSGSRGPVPL